MKNRAMSVAGSFYPADPHSIGEMIHHFNHILEQSSEAVWRYNTLVTYAVIVPHAGWVYSGFTANIAYRVLSGSPVDTIVVIGPSHRVGFRGISLSDSDLYQTPLGDLGVDRELVALLQERFGVISYPAAHHEHSTEVQMPFIRHYFPEVKIVELVYGDCDPALIEPIISYLLQYQKYGVVISTDLSHFYPQQTANRIDERCLNAVAQLDTALLSEGCEACGIIGVEAMLLAAQKGNLESAVLDYRTSADASGDTSRVVGYMSALFQEKLW